MRKHPGFPGGASGKEPACQHTRHKSCRFDPWVGKIPWRRHGNPLQYSCLETPLDRGAWWAMVYRVAKSQTHRSDLACRGMETSQRQKTVFPFLGPDTKKENTQLKWPWVQVPSLSLLGCVTKDKLHNLSVCFKSDFVRTGTKSGGI